MNFCWQRLVLCKELFHVVLDNESTRHQTVNSLLEDISAQIILDNKDRPLAQKSFQAELMAEIAAMEFLFPLKDRLIKLQSPIVDYSQIAEQYRVPKKYVELYLSSSFMKELSKFHNQ